MLDNFLAFTMARDFYQGCKTLRLPLHLKDQLLRSSSSVALNLAESSSCRTEKERIRYFTVALGSLRESQAILKLEAVENPTIIDQADQLGRIIFTLCRPKGEEPSIPPL